MGSFFKSPIDIEISFDGEEDRRHIELNNGSGSGSKTLVDRLPVYEDGESVSGSATIRVKEGKKIEHLGIRVSLIGCIDMLSVGAGSSNGNHVEGRKRSVDEYLVLNQDVCSSGVLSESKSFDFMFKDVSKQYESYRGTNVDVNYYVKVSVQRKGADISKTKKFWVWLYGKDKGADETNGGKAIKLDIGIENCLHIEFEYSKNRYGLKDVIVGRIYFLLTRLKIRHMELSIITRESSLMHGKNKTCDNTAVRYEIMDGSPVKGETIPIRLFLGGHELVPTMSCNKFTVKNYLSLVIIDEDGRRYFKQSEIEFARLRGGEA
ncbi:hypothetical protein TBLA_0D05160 [Henningerozyma blattae CBS 6284]|uniref:Vacuolar protein sorting-associated protein 26 n=1 Tax=Henningerozyma blattae (strain ATCC 34711 / CBS 6284 / DSM 70876 / NBRC 10599 / NRRL Y-10934 / UCD 77-7) TaxID=1071380 RepID=I2H3Q7_HENB6|nr:hypothetical protein TBLA_0D05160 [Tetrapisispora blattae CBS 6284]CCH61009.1 hypothetical protein TBLA_0D05160 [Tetrapisispora blattae CBS 6284]